MHGLKSPGSTSFLKKERRGKANRGLKVRWIFPKPASDCHVASLGATWKNSPLGFLFYFHSQEFHVVIESQHCVHKSKRKTKREKLAPQKTFQKIHIYIYIDTYIDIYIYLSIYIYIYICFCFFVKALREGERESNKMYGNKLAGHAN